MDDSEIMDSPYKMELERGSVTKLISMPSQILNIIDDRYENILHLAPGPNFLEIYDGVNAGYEEFQSLDLMDILHSIALNSGIDTAVKIDAVYRGLKESSVQNHLARLAEWDVEDFHKTGDFWGTPLLELFLDLCVKHPVKYAGLSPFSKIVHPKFPRLIPILDPLFLDFYQAGEISEMTSEKTGEFKIRLTELFDKVKKDILNNLSALEEVRWTLVNMTSGRLDLSVLRVWGLVVCDYQAHTVNAREGKPSSESSGSKGWMEADSGPQVNSLPRKNRKDS